MTQQLDMFSDLGQRPAPVSAAESCIDCRAPFDWTGPSPITGREQGWYRHFLDTRRGRRCADRAACTARACAPVDGSNVPATTPSDDTQGSDA